jgi:UDP-2-acetamido-2,6-beta-L-arabino-hexul-4-ose reductase
MSERLKVGITGSSGFIGRHLYNTLELFPEEFEQVVFDKSYFDDQRLIGFVNSCDVIIHLAAMNRHQDMEIVSDTNVLLVNKLIAALENKKEPTHIIFSSSAQEEKGNLYGRSKKEGREKLEKWASQTNNSISGLVIPNVFGPFGKPFYNSVVATFCYQIANNLSPKIDIDVELKLIYVGELVELMLKKIREKTHEPYCIVKHTMEINVTSILKLLQGYDTMYTKQGAIPFLEKAFEINLFNTFRSFIDHETYFPIKLRKNEDERGEFVEIIRLNIGGQVSFSTTRPGITRGNHFHTRKIERFTVIKGKASIELRKVDEDKVIRFELDGREPSYVDMPIWYTHNITNISNEELLTIFWISEQYNSEDPDTYFVKV